MVTIAVLVVSVIVVETGCVTISVIVTGSLLEFVTILQRFYVCEKNSERWIKIAM
jgi:hypothetical protein